MRHAIGALGGTFLFLAGGAAAVPESAQPVIACESLVGLRLLMGDGGTDHAAALERLPRHPACHLIARDRIGAAEQRAMIGGAPFECLTVRDEARCAWVMP
ncbi:hypothetical protein [Methylobacterium sp. J-090]|uniref:hypothetical protein n=1 Tax=Methylobacterium sp. J-090 TaxID=2836666 RepID=UPI001FBB3AE2|nr:hypothetical protein [Methylobacterium sp. J-090]MCJ2082195.1 hypothetical protein [Methylobacterium sp. J-090]